MPFHIVHEEFAVKAIIDYLKLHGEQLDADLASALHMPLEQIRAELRQLSADKAVMMCFVTRYANGTQVEGFACRLSGFIPPPAPGRRPASAKS